MARHVLRGVVNKKKIREYKSSIARKMLIEQHEKEIHEDEPDNETQKFGRLSVVSEYVRNRHGNQSQDKKRRRTISVDQDLIRLKDTAVIPSCECLNVLCSKENCSWNPTNEKITSPLPLEFSKIGETPACGGCCTVLYEENFSDAESIRNVEAMISSNYNNGDNVQTISAPSHNHDEVDGFVQIGEHISILRGTMHQGNSCFQESSRGKQCTAIAGVAIIAKSLTDIFTWTRDDVDLILLAGDRYYLQSKQELNVNHDYLMATNLSGSFVFNMMTVVVDFPEEGSIYGHVRNDYSDDVFPDLYNGISIFFESFEAGILTCNGKSVAIMQTKADDHFTFYWLFDSHPRGPKGFAAPTNGTASCMKFTNIDSLHSVVRRSFILTKKLNSKDPMCNSYAITPIIVHRVS